MDVELQTGSSDPALALREIRRFANDSGFASQIAVTSNGFCATQRFSFSATSFQQFLADLERMDQTLTGRAELGPQWEDDRLLLEMESNGHVRVTGDLHQLEELRQHLHFEFRTDQTVLAPLVSALRPCLAMPETS